jgi:hypothetical protein
MRTFKALSLTVLLVLGLLGLNSCSRQEPALVEPPPVVPGEVMMNEVFSRGTAGNLDWVEIYNPSSLPINIGGYKIYDPGGQTGVKEKKTIPAGTIVPAKGFFVVVTDTNSNAAVSDGFGLSSAGEQVWLENATGTLIDTITFLAMDVTQSYGRYPDGEAAWAVLSQFTRGTANKQ